MCVGTHGRQRGVRSSGARVGGVEVPENLTQVLWNHCGLSVAKVFLAPKCCFNTQPLDFHSIYILNTEFQGEFYKHFSQLYKNILLCPFP